MLFRSIRGESSIVGGVVEEQEKATAQTTYLHGQVVVGDDVLHVDDVAVLELLHLYVQVIASAVRNNLGNSGARYLGLVENQLFHRGTHV